MTSRNWVLLADGSRAQLYAKNGDDHRDWSLLREFDHPPARLNNHQIMGNRPGHIQHLMEQTAKGTRGGHTVQEEESERFAMELSDYLHNAAARNDFDTLVVAAAPKFLGSLRQRMTKPVHQRVSHYLARNYTSQAPTEFAQHMAGL